MLYRGCVELFSGAGCLLTHSTTLSFWVASDGESDVVLEIDGRRAEPALDRIKDGFGFEVRPPVGARSIVVGALSTQAMLELELSWAPPNLELDRADSARREGRTAEAEELARRQLGGLDDLSRARAAGLLARVAMRQGDQRGAIRSFEQSTSAYAALGCTSGQARDLMALSHLYLYRKRSLSDARRSIEAALDLSMDGSELAAMLPYYRALLATESGDVSGALRFFESSLAYSERLRMRDQESDSRIALVDVLVALGRLKEVRSLLQSHRSNLRDLPACKRAEALNNLGWYLTITAEQAADTVDAPDLLAEALRLWESDCSDPVYRASTLASVARLELLHGRPTEAKLAIARASALEPDGDSWLLASRLEMLATIAHRSGNLDEARVLFGELDQVSNDGLLMLPRWRALLGGAAVAEDQGRPEDALAKYREAELLLDEMAVLVPLGEGRDGFLGAHGNATRRHVALLLERGEPARAMDVVLDARMRALRLLDTSLAVSRLEAGSRRRWERVMARYRAARDRLDAALEEEAAGQWARLELAAEDLRRPLARSAALRVEIGQARAEVKQAINELLALSSSRRGASAVQRRAPAPGELLLATYPLTRGWVVFARTVDGTRAVELDRPLALDPGSLSGLLEPLLEEIDAARIVAFAPHASHDDAGLHGARHRGAPLGLDRDTYFVLDAPPRPPVSGAQRALVVAVDSQGNLQNIEEESAAASRALRSRGFEVTELAGPRATRHAVEEMLSREDVGYFHYAGHARPAGMDGWESRLLLADGGLTATDVLTLPRVPSSIVLSACSGAESGGAEAVGLGLAQAFVMAGATEVLAATRPVEDRKAAAVIEELYARGTMFQPSEVARAAWAAWQGQPGWENFRVVRGW